ncbi:MAG: MarR family winged helix-turn-helix transcriptional regulator, partial [Terracoccus sp.]
STNLRLDDQLCFALYAATNAVTRAYRPLLRAVGLTYSQYLVMLVLWEQDHVAVHEIADRLELAPHAISPLLGRLEEAELVVRRRDVADRRVTWVELTEGGAALEAEASAAQYAVVDQTRLCSGELDDLRDTLRELVSRMGVDSGSRAPHVAQVPGHDRSTDT